MVYCLRISTINSFIVTACEVKSSTAYEANLMFSKVSLEILFILVIEEVISLLAWLCSEEEVLMEVIS